MDRKLLAKYHALKKTSDSLKEDSRKPIADELKAKKLSKVTVVAPDEKSLKKGLTKAQELLRAKFGDLGLEEDEMEEAEEELEPCAVCDDKGCPECYGEEASEESEEDVPESDEE